MPRYHGDWCRCEECTEALEEEIYNEAQENPTPIEMEDLDQIDEVEHERQERDVEKRQADGHGPLVVGRRSAALPHRA
jgi:hypothetical protein